MIAEQGGDLDEVLTGRQAELAMVDEMGIVLDTDPSEVNGSGSAQSAMQPFEDTQAPANDDGEESDDEY